MRINRFPVKSGDLIKCRFPSREPGMPAYRCPRETPWATVLRIVSQTIVQARLENNLLSGAGRFGDVYTFQWRDSPLNPDDFIWEVCPEWEQLPVGPLQRQREN
jgi:hypothetical protein